MAHVDLADKFRDVRARVDAESPAEGRELPKFARLTRKDTLIRADQHTALTALAKSLMRRRLVKSERITENTLIRIAIDLLFAHADSLRGSTEDELRNSVSHKVPNSRPSATADSGTSGGPEYARSEVSGSEEPTGRLISAADLRERRTGCELEDPGPPSRMTSGRGSADGSCSVCTDGVPR